jgi:HlyD family secretion protein
MGAIAAILVTAGVYLWKGRHASGGPLQLSGNVEIRQVNLAFKVAGRIVRLNVDEGDAVREGQVLASLDKVYFEDSLAQAQSQRDQSAANLAKMVAGNRKEDIAQAEANVADREATFANAGETFERADRLLKTGSGTRKAYDDAFAARKEAQARLNLARHALDLMRAGFRREDIDLARAQLAQRDAELAQARRNLADAELKAPSTGTVLTRVRENGAIVNAGETTFVLSLTSPVWVRSYVSELDLGRVRPGMEVEVRTDSPSIAPLTGRIGFISQTAEFTPKTVETRELRTALVYRLRVVLDDPANSLRQGMPITISVPPLPEDGK